MAWQMPTSAQWGSGMANMAIAPDMNMANMNTYTPEQWAAMQQQNWQQWTQWQQQYAQWQGQFGEKYNEQMQAIQAMGGMPPLPPANTAPPPAPPPPDQPPPPPHENNQPLYGSASSQPAPVPAPTANHRNNTSGNHANINTHPQAARDFIEPVHMFDYNHKSKDGDVKRKDFDLEKEVDELFSRKPRRPEKEIDYSRERYSRDHYSRDFERRAPREDLRDDFRPRVPPRDDYEDRRRLDSRYDDRRRDERDEDRRRDDREKYSRREDIYRDRERDYRDRDHGKDVRRDEIRHRSRSRERDSRKRGLSRDSESSINHSTKKSKDKDESVANTPASSKHIVMIDDLLESPGRSMRPDKIVIILRGPPGSGKSYLAKLIRDREAEYGGTVRIMSIDDYFMQEGEVEERDPSTGKMVKKPTLKYEYDESSEETYLNSLKRAFKRSLTDGYFTFLIYDAVNDQLKCYADIWNYARQNGFQVYICTMELDPQVCFKRNIHNRKLEDIEVLSARFFPTPSHHIQLDATTLLQNAAITEVQMEDADDEVVMEDAQEPEVESVFTSKWEKMDDAAQLARLDGTSKPLRPSQLSMEDYLQLDDWTPNTAKPGKKSVRWADIEERKQQEKMRAVGFVVGQTDWNRMTDPTMGSSALTQTKYIERVRRN
ncbi:YLP motif-containing protein 1 isoform X3 [Helicoverpa zea]|uniref:YLP motif-containing protein 1 isoform X3 n=1 Tax=Helicoverpa zea TaxID=7113 RepID=UPI001F57B823|nr:YLP motif-containing protein 1 isoform X3 [Helicoverpa zea]